MEDCGRENVEVQSLERENVSECWKVVELKGTGGEGSVVMGGLNKQNGKAEMEGNDGVGYARAL